MNAQCLCSSVRLSSPDTREIGVCHCGVCRRWGGGPLLAVHCGADVHIEGSEHITDYASSQWAARGFCSKCGTHLYYKLLSSGEYFVPAGLFDTTEFELTSQIYVDNKPDYYSFSNETPMLTEQQFLERFAPPGGDTAA
ncbi:GFA family protein [Rubrivivax sp. RP6-9]|uniref:GFA family protein n=1 Tax=Rubrivivax sp. RP6-9 TaxID=3415750 RepID=UPI003CC5AC9D